VEVILPTETSTALQEWTTSTDSLGH
jgi:hypothetical protein